MEKAGAAWAGKKRGVWHVAGGTADNFRGTTPLKEQAAKCKSWRKTFYTPQVPSTQQKESGETLKV